MLGDAEGETQVAQFGIGRRALGHRFQIHVVDDGVVARLHEEAAGDGLGGEACGARIGQAAGEQQPQILLGADDRYGLRRCLRRDDDFGENLGNRTRRIGVERAVERDDAAERRDRIAGQRLAISVEQAFALRHAARIGVLDDRTRCRARRIEFGDAFVSRVGVVDVVVGELLALGLPRGRDAETGVRRAIERRRLVRVLAVAQFLDQPAAEGAIVRRDVGKRVGEPIRNRRVIGRSARIGLGGEPEAERKRCRASVLRKLGQHRGVIAGLDDDGDVVVVLCRGADHRRAADVDVFDTVGEIGAARRRGFERIEIDHQKIDRPDVVRPHCFGVRGVVAHRQQAAMDRRMQRLDPAVHHLRESSEIADVEHGEPGVAQNLARAAGGNQLDAVAGQRASEVDDAGLVGN